MTDRRDRESQYVTESARMHWSLNRVEKLRAALEAAEELEAHGVTWEEAWRNDKDWQRLERIKLMLTSAQIWIDVGTSQGHEDAWRERRDKRLSIHRVK